MVRQTFFLFCSLLMMLPIYGNSVADFPKVSEKTQTNWFSLGEATICTDASDYKVVNIAAQMLADDVERVTTTRSTIVSATSLKKLHHGATVIVGTIGHSRIIDELVRQKAIDVSAIKGKWESYIITTINHPRQGQILVIAGSDRRGTAFGLLPGVPVKCFVRTTKSPSEVKQRLTYRSL